MTIKQRQQLQEIGQQVKQVMPDLQGFVKFNLTKINKAVKIECNDFFESAPIEPKKP